MHMVWALSKDFGASGFRVGVLCTQNELVAAAIGNLNIFTGVSFPMQAVVANLLADDAFVDDFLAFSSRALVESYSIVTTTLEELHIGFIPVQAGIFVYCDFSSMLPSQSSDGEKRFAALVMKAARIVMTPGQSQRDLKPGMFRICYAWVSSDVLKIAMSRLTAICKVIGEQGWEGLDETDITVV